MSCHCVKIIIADSVDFVSMATSVSFTPQAEEGDTSCVAISIIDDDDIEDDEEFSICISSGSNILVQEGRDTQTVSIVDIDRMLFALHMSTF